MSRPGITIAPGFGYGYGYSPFISPFSPIVPFYGGAAVVSRGPGFFDLLFITGFVFAAS
jgi:hypothetical protein